ncbi:MAG: hypothetical protein HY647_12435 [Acidobacteria bacterium]|nr:hypothetical protein [Acidobacteriota bacterium]
MKRAVLFPYTFVLMNWAVVVSLYQFLRQGNNIYKDVWIRHSPHAHGVHGHG